jgi:hypothetical protein
MIFSFNSVRVGTGALAVAGLAFGAAARRGLEIVLLFATAGFFLAGFGFATSATSFFAGGAAAAAAA